MMKKIKTESSHIELTIVNVLVCNLLGFYFSMN